MRRPTIFKSALLAALVFASACGGNKTAEKTEETEEETRKMLVKTSVSTIETVDITEEFSGTIQPYIQNKISPDNPMRIDRIFVEVGDQVRKGQLLVQMDQSSFLQSAVQLSNLETDLARYQNLYQEGGISKQQLDQMETQVSVARHAIDNLKENTELRSPIDGVVTERVYDNGDLYSATDGRILTVMQVSRVKIEINISEAYFPMVKVGMPVNVQVDVYPNEVFEGKISLIHPAVDDATRTFTIEITIPNGNGKLRPGMFARATLNFGNAQRILIDDVAVQKQQGSNERYLFTVSGGKAHRRVVQSGRIIGNKIEILSGLEAGEEVVVAGAPKLLDGSDVEVSN